MSEDKTPNPPPQGAAGSATSNLSGNNLVERMAGTLLPNVWVGSTGSVAGLKGGFYDAKTYASFDPTQAHYVSSALIRTGATTRSADTFKAAWLFVLDDVMAATVVGNDKQIPKDAVDMLAPPPNAIVQTSLGNYQYFYRLEPEPDFNRWNYFLEMTKLHSLIGPSAKQGDAVHYYRSGTGTNPKNGFQTKVLQDYDGGIWRLNDLAAGFGIDMSPETIKAWAARKPALPADEYASDEVLLEIIKLIPNDSWFDDRSRWNSMGFALKNASRDSPVIRDAWIEWDRPGPNGSDAARFWDTAYDPRAGLGTLRKEIERRYGEKSKQREWVHQIHSRETFDPIPEDEKARLDETMPKPKAEKEFDRLLAEIAKLQPMPSRHAEPPDTQLDDVFDLMAKTQVDAPMIISPYLRGKLSTIGGPPGKGKSLLLEQQCLAIALERPDLIRRGQERLQLPGDVLYFCNEDGKRIFTQRAAAWAKRFNVDVTKRRYQVIPVVSNLLRKEGDNVIIECVALLREVLKHLQTGRQIAFIAIDTVPASTEGIEENSAKEMGHVHRLLDRFAKAFWAAMAMVTHTSKTNWDGGGGRSMASIRGSGATVGTSRGVVTLSDPTKEEAPLYPAGTVIEWVVKAAAGRQGYEACAYQLEVVDIEVEDAETPGKMVMKGQPVLVPVVARITAFVDEDELGSLKDDLDGWLDGGVVVWVARATSTSGNQDALHNRWQKTPKETEEIVSKMCERGWFKLATEEYDKHLKQKIRKVLR